MKGKKHLLLILLCGLALGVLGVRAVAGSRPFQDLDASQIAAATVYLSPPDKTVVIPDTEELISYLQNVRIYRRDPSYTEYAGQGALFSLTMRDGTQREILAFNPFLVIDGVSYRTQYAPCEALNRYANECLNAQDAVILLESPPALTVISDNTACGALPGTYSWQKKAADGSMIHTLADSAHPLECKDLLAPLDTSAPTAVLQFAENPDAILSLRCWSDALWGDVTADSEPVSFEGFEIELKPGGHIYEVRAKWDPEAGCGGTACYAFYINAPGEAQESAPA